MLQISRTGEKYKFSKHTYKKYGIFHLYGTLETIEQIRNQFQNIPNEAYYSYNDVGVPIWSLRFFTRTVDDEIILKMYFQ